MRASALTAVLGSIFVAAVVALPGCGDDEEPKEEEKKGDSIECGPDMCDPVILPMPDQYPPIPACCAGPNEDECGLDGSRFEEFGAVFEDPCQPLDQPGEEDTECPSSPPVPTDFGMLDFPGCCKPEGTCGYLVNDAFGLVTLGLGCVDAAPFLADGGTPTTCTPD